MEYTYTPSQVRKFPQGLSACTKPNKAGATLAERCAVHTHNSIAIRVRQALKTFLREVR